MPVSCWQALCAGCHCAVAALTLLLHIVVTCVGMHVDCWWDLEGCACLLVCDRYTSNMCVRILHSRRGEGCALHALVS